MTTLIVSSGKDRTLARAPQDRRPKVTSGCSLHDHWRHGCANCDRQLVRTIEVGKRRELRDLARLQRTAPGFDGPTFRNVWPEEAA